MSRSEGAPLSDVTALLLRTGLSYAAWTQIIPAVLAWLFAILVLTALVLIGIDARGGDPTSIMQAVAERFPGFSSRLGGWFETRVAPSIQAATDPETGAVHLDRIDFWGAASYLWFWLSVAGTALGFVWRMVFGPRPGQPLGRKLSLVVGACAAYTVALFVTLMALPPNFRGDTLEWVGLAIGAGLIVCVVTSYSVAVAHGLGKLADALATNAQEG